jgi:hypothetical protein
MEKKNFEQMIYLWTQGRNEYFKVDGLQFMKGRVQFAKYNEPCCAIVDKEQKMQIHYFEDECCFIVTTELSESKRKPIKIRIEESLTEAFRERGHVPVIIRASKIVPTESLCETIIKDSINAVWEVKQQVESRKFIIDEKVLEATIFNFEKAADFFPTFWNTFEKMKKDFEKGKGFDIPEKLYFFISFLNEDEEHKKFQEKIAFKKTVYENRFKTIR